MASSALLPPFSADGRAGEWLRGMGKILLLRRLCRAKFFSALSIEELRLYLLLLADAKTLDREAFIDIEVVRKVLGAGLSLARLRRLTGSLRRRGLAKVVLPPKEVLPSRLAYTVFGPRETKRDGAKRREGRKRRRQGPGRRGQRADPRGDH